MGPWLRELAPRGHDVGSRNLGLVVSYNFVLVIGLNGKLHQMERFISNVEFMSRLQFDISLQVKRSNP